MIRLASGKQCRSPSSHCCCCDTNLACNPGRPATEHFTGRVFGLPSHLFCPHHTALLQGLRAQLTPAKVPSHGHVLLSSMQLESDRILTSSGKVTCWPVCCICRAYAIFSINILCLPAHKNVIRVFVQSSFCACAHKPHCGSHTYVLQYESSMSMTNITCALQKHYT